MIILSEKSLNKFLKAFVFYIVFYLVCVLPTVNFSVYYFPTIFPSLASMFVFHFNILEKEDRISYFSLFIFGVFFDAINQLPLGSTSIIWLLSLKIVSYVKSKLFIPSYLITIIRDYILYLIIGIIFRYILFYIFYGNLLPFFEIFKQFIVDIIIYVILYRFFEKIKIFCYA